MPPLKKNIFSVPGILVLPFLLSGCLEIENIDLNYRIGKDLNVFQTHTLRGIRPSPTYGPKKIPRTDEEIRQMMEDFYAGGFNNLEHGLRMEAYEKGTSFHMYSATLLNTTPTSCDARIQARSLPVGSVIPLFIGNRNFSIESSDSTFSFRLHPDNNKDGPRWKKTRLNLTVSYAGTITEHNGRESESDPQTITWNHDDLMSKGVYIVLVKQE